MPFNNVAKAALASAKAINDDVKDLLLPASEVAFSHNQRVLPFVYFKRCNRRYITDIVHQINLTYEATCYDACFVMIRRLIETLIIEVYTAKGITHKIKNSSEDFLQLGDLISTIIKEPQCNLTRNAKRGLEKGKFTGDLSAHNRYYIANREDIDEGTTALRATVKELLHHANLG